MAATDPDQATPLDVQHLRRYTEGDEDLERQLFGMFFPDADVHLQTMSSAETDEIWHRSAHGLKGAARGLGAWEVAGLAEDAEAMVGGATEGRAGHLERMRAALARLRVVVEDLLGAVEPPAGD